MSWKPDWHWHDCHRISSIVTWSISSKTSLICDRERIPTAQYVHSKAHVLTRLTRRVPLVEQKLSTLPEHMSSTSVFSGVRVTQSLVLCVVFSKSLFVFLFFFCSSIYGFWSPLWYLQTLLKQWLSTHSTNIRKHTLTSHLNSLNTKNTTTYDIRNPCPVLGQAQKW